MFRFELRYWFCDNIEVVFKPPSDLPLDIFVHLFYLPTDFYNSYILYFIFLAILLTHFMWLIHCSKQCGWCILFSQRKIVNLVQEFQLSCFVCFFLQSTGEAQEVLSLRQGPVRLVRMLKTPQEGETVTIDNYCATTAVSLWLHTLGILMSHTSLLLCFTSHPR